MFKRLLSKKALLISFVLILFLAIPSAFAEDSSAIDMATDIAADSSFAANSVSSVDSYISDSTGNSLDDFGNSIGDSISDNLNANLSFENSELNDKLVSQDSVIINNGKDKASSVLAANKVSEDSVWYIVESGAGYDTIAEAISAAESGNTIICNDKATETLSNVTISKSLTIKANNLGDVVFSTNGKNAFYLNSNYELNLVNICFNNIVLNSNVRGGAVYAYGDLTVENCQFSNIRANNQYNYGSAIYSDYKRKINIINSRFENITSSQAPVYMSQNVLNVVNSTFINTRSSAGAGAIYMWGSNASIENTSFLDSSTSQVMIYATASNIDLNNCTFRNITCSGTSAAIYTWGTANLTVNNSIFDSCKSTTYSGDAAGAILSESNDAQIMNSTFINCNQSGYFSSNYTERYFAGAVLIDYGAINYCIFLNNTINPNSRSQTTKYAVYSADVAAFEAINADYNYWGSNSGPNSSQIGDTVNVNNWYILDMDIDGDVKLNVDKDITFTLNQVKDSDGTVTDAPAIQDINCTVEYALSESESTPLNIIDGQGAITYYPTDIGDETLSVLPGSETFTFNVNANDLLSIYVANNGSNSNDGTADSPYQTIEYALSQVTDTRNIIYVKSGTYREHDLTIDKSVSIVSEGEVTIDAEENGRIFIIEDSIDLVLREMTLINAKTDSDGGAIYMAAGNLTLNTMVIKDSSAANGGALYIAGTSYIFDSEFVNNSASSNGGAIAIGGTSENTIKTSIFTNNTAGVNGGAIYDVSTLNLSSSNLQDNGALANGGALYAENYNVLVDGNTFRNDSALNGGAIYIKGSNTQNKANIKNNIMTRNKASQGGNIYLSDIAANLNNNSMSLYLAANGGKIYLDNSKINGVLTFSNNGSEEYITSTSIDLKANFTDDMGNLVDGGSVVFTLDGVEYQTASIENGVAVVPFSIDETDGSEIIVSGSYEGASSDSTVVNSVIHPSLKYWFVEGGNAYEYFADAVANAADGGVIYGLPGTYNISNFKIQKSLTIKALNNGEIILNGNNDRIFNLTHVGSTFNLINLTLTNGASTGFGGLIELNGTLNLINCTLKDAITRGSSSQGGAIFAWNGSKVNVDSSVFRNLSAVRGGAIYCFYTDSQLNVNNSLFDNVSSTESGSAIYSSGIVNVNGTNFTNINGPYYPTSLSDYGGAIYVRSDINVDNSRFINITGLRASAIYLDSATANLNVQHSVFADNIATNTTIYSKGMNNYINYCIFADNLANGNYWDFIGNGYYLETNDLDYNYWGSNEEPVYNFNFEKVDLNNWVILNLTARESVLIANSNIDIKADLYQYTDGEAIYDLEDEMPDFRFDLDATAGSIASTVEISDKSSTVVYTAPNENTHVIISIEPSNVILEFDVITSESLLYVSKNGSDLTGDGSLSRPYATIGYALGKVNDSKNIIFIADGKYDEHDLVVNKPVTIQGQSTDVIIDAQGLGLIFNITSDAEDVIIKSLSLVNASSNDGGAIYSDAKLTLFNSIINSSSATDGGSVYLNNDATIYDNKFIDIDGNSAIYINAGYVNLTNNTMENVPVDAIYLNGGFVNAVIVYLNNKSIEIPKNTETTLNATVTDDSGNPITGGFLEFNRGGIFIDSADVKEGMASIDYTTPNMEVTYLISGMYSNANNEYVLKSGTLRVIKLGWFIGETGYETLSQAIDAAEDGDTIVGVPGNYTVGYEPIQKDVTIKANESGSIVLHIDGRYFLDVIGDYNLNLEGLIIEDAEGYKGFFVYNENGTVNIDNCTFRDSSLSTIFAVITSEYGVLNINNSNFVNLTLTDSTSSEWGGAIYGIHSIVNIENSRFENTSAGSYGGAICSYSSSDVTVKNTTFINSRSSFRGGAIYNGGYSNVTVLNCTFINNTATSYGGAICSETGNINVNGSVFIDNVGVRRGGAIYLTRNATINYNIFLNNINSNSNGGNDVYFYWYNETYPEEYIDVNYNYWGTNDGPDSSNVYCDIESANIIMDKWSILKVGINSTNVTIGPDYAVTMDLSQYLCDGNVLVLDGIMPYLPIDLSASLGSLNPESVLVEDGKATVIYSPNNIGEETISFSNSDQYLKFNVNFGSDYILSPSVTAVTIDLGESSIVNVSVLNKFREISNDLDNQNVVISYTEIVNGTKTNNTFTLVGKTINDGSFTFDLKEMTELKAGSIYQISFAITDDDYDVESGIVNLNVNRQSTSLDAEDLDAYVGSGTIDIGLIGHDDVASFDSYLADKDILVTIGEESTSIRTNSQGIAQFDASNLLSGEYDILITFEGDNEYLPSNITVKLNISKYPTSIDAKDQNISLGDLVLNISLDSVDEDMQYKNISVVISYENGTTYLDTVLETDDNSFASIDLSSMPVGNYIANIIFAGDDKYESSTKEITISIYEIIVSLYAEDINITEGSGSLDIYLSANGVPLSGKIVNVEIVDDSIRRVTNNEGVVTVDLSSLTMGEYLIIFSFDSDGEYPSVFNSSTVFVLSNGTAPANDTDTNGTDTNGTDTNGTDANDTSNVRDGSFIQELINNASAGDVIDLGNYTYENVSNIKINKDIALVGNNTTIKSANDGNPIFVVDTLSDDVENLTIRGINFELDNGDKVVKVIAKNGTSPLSIETPSVSIKNNTFAAANEKVVPESITILELDAERGILAPSRKLEVISNTLDSGMNPFDFVVTGVSNSSGADIPEGGNILDKTLTSFIFSNMTTYAIDVNVDGRVGSYFNLKLVDSEGNALANKAVQIGFNGKIYNRTTNATGEAQLQINLGVEGGYTFALCFLGDDNYNSTFAVAKITVTLQKAKLTTAKKTYKASAKTKSLTATFKTLEGNPISGKTVTFTVNGKTYTGKTNSKGVATVKVSLSTKKTYSFTAKFAGDKRYAATSVKSTVVIK